MSGHEDGVDAYVNKEAIEVANSPAVDATGQEEFYTEIGNFRKPPLLEDVTVTGPLHLSSKSKLKTIEDREQVEYDFNWFRYSRLSTSLLLGILVFVLVSLALTLDQNNGQIGFHLLARISTGAVRDGTPRSLEPFYLHAATPDRESGLNRATRTCRIVSFSFGFLSVALLLGSIFLKPRPGPKGRAIFLLAGISALITCICSVLAFSFTIRQNHRVYSWEEDYRLTFSPKQDIRGWTGASTAIDIIVFAVSLTVFAMCLIWGAFNRDIRRLRTGWKERSRDADALAGAGASRRNEESHDDRFYRYHTRRLYSPMGEVIDSQNTVRKSRTQLATFIGLAFLLVLVIQLILMLVLHNQTHVNGRLYNRRGKGNRTFRQDPWDVVESERTAGGNWISTSGFERDRKTSSIHIDDTSMSEVSGWSITNTRLRGFCIFGLIFLFFVTLLPFRSRTVAYSLGLLWFIFGVAWFSSAVMDIDEVRDASNLPCPIDIASGYDYRPSYLREMDVWNVNQHEDKDMHTQDLSQVQGDPFLASSSRLRERMIWQYKCNVDRYNFTACWSLFGSLLVFAFVLLEYVSKQFTKCQWCGRGYLFCEKHRHETKECSMRPVECEICHIPLPAQEFVYRHRLTCGRDHVRCRLCNKPVPQGYLAKHENEHCPYAPIQCSMCRKTFRKFEFETADPAQSHVLNCPMKPTTCEFCGQDFPRRDIDQHKNVCGEAKVDCPHCSIKLRKTAYDHHEKFLCKFRLMSCEGCGEEVRFLELEHHKKTECPSRLVVCERCKATCAASDRQLHASVCTQRL